jgi:hypothetical protein
LKFLRFSCPPNPVLFVVSFLACVFLFVLFQVSVEIFLEIDDPSHLDITSKETRRLVGGGCLYFGFGLRRSFIVIVLLNIALCVDAIVVAVVRVIFVCDHAC